MKLNKIFTLVIIVATLFFVGCSSDEPQTENSNIIEPEENSQIENPSEDEEEVVEYFEAEEEDIDLGELI